MTTREYPDRDAARPECPTCEAELAAARKVLESIAAPLNQRAIADGWENIVDAFQKRARAFLDATEEQE